MTAQQKISEVRFESLRVPIDCAVDLKFESSSAPKRMIAANISMRGMFIRGTDQYEPGTVCEVRFALQENEPPVRGKAEVLWSRQRDKGPDRPKGIGIRFLDLDLESKYQVSRLVDQYIQLGGLPFQLGNAKVGGTAVPRRRPASRSAFLFPLVFIAGLTAGSIGSLWLVKPSDPRLETAFTADSPRAFTSATHADGSSPAGTTKRIDPTPEEVVAIVEAWAAAWAEKNIERYLSFYSDDFRPATNSSLEAWKSQRQNRLRQPGAIAVEISAIEVESTDVGRAIARFDQGFASPGYRDRTTKSLELAREDGHWRIVREEALLQVDR